jgi:hypothetical protein
LSRCCTSSAPGDRYIANHFLRHFLRLGLEGGVIGGGAAMLGFGFSESIAAWFSGTPVGDQFAALLGTFSLPPSGYLALAGTGRGDRRHYRLGVAANPVRHARRHRLSRPMAFCSEASHGPDPGPGLHFV